MSDARLTPHSVTWITMNPSSRTPEGIPERCPICGNSVRLEPSSFPSSDAPCPHCGYLLWFAVESVDGDQTASECEFAAESLQSARLARRVPSACSENEPFDRTDRKTWWLIAALTTLVVVLHDGLTVTTILWLPGISVFGQLVLPRLFRCTGEFLRHRENFYLGCVLGWGLVPGPAVGVVLGVLLPWVYESACTSFAGGLIGLLVGPCFAMIEGLVVATVFDLIFRAVTGKSLSKL
jgi:hypothetical protein